jgi:Fructose-bisphosphate aldolase class-II
MSRAAGARPGASMADMQTVAGSRHSPRLDNVLTLREVLIPANRQGFGVGAFAARYIAMVRPTLQAAQAIASPAILQISEEAAA